MGMIRKSKRAQQSRIERKKERKINDKKDKQQRHIELMSIEH